MNPFFPAQVLYLGSILFVLTGHTAQAASQVDTCSPKFRAIYDFQVGDIFERSSTQSGLYGLPDSITVSKSTITSKLAGPGEVTYTVTGIIQRAYFKQGKEVNRVARTFADTLHYVDSVSAPLNQCKDAYVRIRPEDTLSRFVSKIGVATGKTPSFPLSDSSTRLKSIGEGGVGTLNQGVFKPISDYTYFQAYAEGLGLVEYSEWSWEPIIKISLTGYVKAGDTVGVVTPDPKLLEATTILKTSSQARIPGFPSSKTGFGRWNGFDLQGRQFRFR
jgi:hypothetical protein